MAPEQEAEQLITIGEVARMLDLTTRTLRYWEEMGVVEASHRSEGGNRLYTPYMVRRMKFIIKLKELGLTIKEMQELGAAYGEARKTENMIPRLVEILDSHINKVDEKMANLASLRKDIVDYRHRMIEKFNFSKK
ncbi:transcriptional regulator, MerR family [Geobacter metallireducens RCH3]|uniref:Helix-turn-helix transcriptional regulator, MerR family n=1 Tax=Geobacter metallireducens (strain ATCC 53774 / DSM 7210 / GS-15) TaxID=269799 RepID=Q39UW9_GEOMG|nr:MerR family transcriptional regulator [Geobacter metallireducens]ABB31955.1 helix-turn-helix transcriptional regulator, MerR family [Geobacter metallireducens GS-15]EHP86332.1 transcriptional regulator, MerR family [Geobacter metallireducens RCH3]